MNVQITNLGVAALTAGGGAPVQLTVCKFGSAYGYIPALTDTNIHGTELFQVAPSGPVDVNGNTVQYSAYLDYSVGDFDWGEFGLFMQNGDLFALGTGDALIAKIKQTSALTGNAIRLDVYLNMVGTNYEMWLDLANTNNNFRIATIQGIDYLPPSANAVPNVYIVQSAEPTQTSFQAYTDRQGLWNFDAYAYSTTAAHPLTVTAATNTSVSFALADYSSDMIPNYLGERIIQFNSGNLYSICRNVQSIVQGGTAATINFATPLAIVPVVGSTFFYYNRDPYSTTNVSVPPATTTSLGVVKIGTGLKVNVAPQADPGLLSVDRVTIDGGIVFSVNSMQGDVTLTAADIPGSVRTVNGVGPDASGNVVVSIAPGQIPIATTTTVGGVKASALVTVAADGTMGLGFTPVTSVNGQSGNVAIVGLITPTAIANGTDLNTLTTAGLYFALTDAIAISVSNGPTPPTGTRTSASLEVIPFTVTGSGGDVIQRWTQHGYMAERRLTGATWSTWAAVGASNTQVASKTQLGVMQVGDGLNVVGGLVSTQIQAVNGKSDQFITLTAEDVGAIPLDQLGVQAGAAELNLDPNPPVISDPPTAADNNALALSDYIYRRLLPNESELGTWVSRGSWNASTNVAVYTSSKPSPPPDPPVVTTHTVTLQSGGLMTDTTDDVPPVTFQATGSGLVFVVSVAGTTVIDGIGQWNVGDLVVGVDNVWRRIPATIAPEVTPTISTASLTPGGLLTGVFYYYTGPTVSLAMTTGLTVQEFTIYTTTNAVTFTGAVNASGSGGTIIPGGCVASAKKLPTGNYLIFGDTAT